MCSHFIEHRVIHFPQFIQQENGGDSLDRNKQLYHHRLLFQEDRMRKRKSF